MKTFNLKKLINERNSNGILWNLRGNNEKNYY